MMKIIDINNFTKSFGEKVIFQNFNLEIEKGDMVAIIGPSGSGKTTLLNVIGLIEPIEKQTSYLFDGKPAPKCNTKQAINMIRDNISYLFQNFALVDNYTVEQNLLLALKYVKKSKAEKKQLINNALKKVGLDAFNDQKIYEISGGEQQRVALARAILKPSKVILADEPTGSLDSKNRDEILRILKELNNEGKTIIIVTHDLDVANACNHIVDIS